MLPQSPYSSGELSAMNSFLTNSGGTLFLIGEGQNYAPGGTAFPFLNNALSSLSSGLSFIPANDDVGPHTSTGAEIASNSLTSGVANFGYAFASETRGGSPLFFVTSGAPFISTESGSTNPVPEPRTLGLMFVCIAAIGYSFCRCSKFGSARPEIGFNSRDNRFSECAEGRKGDFLVTGNAHQFRGRQQDCLLYLNSRPL